MAKSYYETDPMMEARLMEALSPAVEVAFDKHMTTGPRKSLPDGPPADMLAGTLDPLEELYTAAGLEPQDNVTTELVDTVRGSFDEHVAQLESQGLDARPVIALAGLMNLSTENNLPWYHAEQLLTFQGYTPFVEMLSRWTAEEADHGPLIEQWGQLSGAISPRDAHRIKMALLTGGIGVATESVVGLNAFTDPQELDTGDAHRNYGRILDSIGRANMNRIANQEFRHGKLFGDLGAAMYGLDQEFIDYALPIEAATQRHFAMPAAESYPNFKDASVQIAVHGLFTLEGVIARQRQRVERLNLLNLSTATDAAKEAQETLAQVIDLSSRLNSIRFRTVERATEKYIAAEKAAGRVPLILGRTVVFENSQLHVVPSAA